MRKIIYLSLLLCWVFLFSSQMFAFGALEYVKLDDGRHFCSPFMTDNFQLCSELGIEYDWDSVISWVVDFPADWLATIEGTSRCIKQGKEAPLNDCNETYFKVSNDWNFECVVKNGVENCTKQDEYGLDSWENAINSLEDNQTSNTSSHSTCKVNGQEVDCAEMTANMKNTFSVILKYWIVLGIIGLVATIFYIWMLVHAITKPIPNKIIWILVIFFLSPIWAIVYYFAIKRHFNEWIGTVSTSSQTVPYAMNVGVTYNEWPVITSTSAQVEWTSQISSPESNTPSPTV